MRSVLNQKTLKRYIQIGFLFSKLAKNIGSNLMYKFVFRYYFNLKLLGSSKKETFFGEGFGTGGNRVFRKVYHQETWLFEKILNTNSIEFINSDYFHSNVYKSFIEESGLQTPRLVKKIKNNNICAFYFELVKFVPCKTVNEHLIFGMAAVRGLFKINLENDGFLKTSKSMEFFNTNKYLLEQFDFFGIANLTGLNFNEFFETAFDLRLVFSHGDLWSNVSNNLIIDWDSSGFYPDGYDLSLLLAKYSRHEFTNSNIRITGSDVLRFIEYCTAQFIYPLKSKSWNVLFFTFIFMKKYHSQREFDIISVLKLNDKLSSNNN
jgi:hypothetical protein